MLIALVYSSRRQDKLLYQILDQLVEMNKTLKDNSTNVSNVSKAVYGVAVAPLLTESNAASVRANSWIYNAGALTSGSYNVGASTSGAYNVGASTS